MSMLCNCCVRELLILARTWFTFGLPSKTGCDTRAQRGRLGVGEAVAREAAGARGDRETLRKVREEREEIRLREVKNKKHNFLE
jgi:hypothetical protein